MQLGIGIGFYGNNGQLIAVYYPNPLCAKDPSSAVFHDAGFFGCQPGLTELDPAACQNISAALSEKHPQDFKAECTLLQSRFATASRRPVLWYSDADNPPDDVAGAYLKLHLISTRKFRPHQLNLTGLFKVLPNVAWSSCGPLLPGEVAEKRLQMLAEGSFLEVFSVDKFPKMTDFVVPSGVRIADTARVRLGAYVGENTTVMHEGFINFNAGSLGPNMIEGRISAGVFVDTGSDLGGGCSTMGTLSGGGNQIISVGKDCLIGANAGIGISLGDKCTVESGLYVTAGTVISLLDSTGKEVAKVKARELSGKNELLFRRNSQTGKVECLTKRNRVELNSELHSFN